LFPFLSFISADCAVPSRADLIQCAPSFIRVRRGEEEEEEKKKKKKRQKQVLCSVRAILMLALKLMFITDYC
jgi:hypothetical protein